MLSCAQAQQSMCLAVGLWEANEVQLMSLTEATSLHTLFLSSGHARSIVAGQLDSQHMIFVGTSDGSVVYCPTPALHKLQNDSSRMGW